jgi:hypothetical protein
MVPLQLTASYDPPGHGWDGNVYIWLNDQSILSLPTGQLWDEPDRTEQEVVAAAIEDWAQQLQRFVDERGRT